MRAHVLPLLALVTACGSVAPRAAVPPPVSGPEGHPAETVDFELPDARGGPPVRLSDLRGKVVLVHYFTTWCAMCEGEFQNYEALLADPEHVAASDLAVVGVALDLDGRRLLPPFLEVRGLKYPVLLADEAMLHGTTPFGPVRAVPTTFLIDASGRHVDSFPGVVPPEFVRSRLRALAP